MRFGILAFLAVLLVNVAVGEEPAATRYELSPSVAEVVQPLIDRLANAKITRVTVQSTTETVRDGELIQSDAAQYQIASAADNRCTIYYKADDRQVRLFRDGQSQIAAFKPNEYATLPEPGTFEQLIRVQPVPLGIYAEPVLALALAGVDTGSWMLDGMASIESLGKQKFRGTSEAFRIRGQQNDGVVWDLWLRDDPGRTPLRLTLDLTPMLRTSDGLEVPEGLQMSVRMDFMSYRTEGKLDETMFTYRPPADAQSFAGYQEYVNAQIEPSNPSIGVDSTIGALGLQTIDGEPWDESQLDGTTTVLDFFASWCVPCTKTIAPLAEAVGQIDGVEYLAIAVGENPVMLRGFVAQQGWTATVLVDDDGGAIAATGGAAVPRTVVIGPDRKIRWIDTGTSGRADLAVRLSEKLKSSNGNQ